jgi:hypothetical protein
LAIILTSLAPLGTVYNFIALAVIADFDNFVFESMPDEPFRKLLEEELVRVNFSIHHTTSRRCSYEEMRTEKDINGNLVPLRIRFGQRDCWNKTAYLFYKFCRLWYTAFYFYFLPFVVIVLSVVLPGIAENKGYPPVPLT